MGCGCYDGKREESSNENQKRRRQTFDSSEKNSNKFNNNKETDNFNKLSSISSFISKNSNDKSKRERKNNKLINEKKNNNALRKYHSAKKPILMKEIQIICNISLINYNDKRDKKFNIRINKSGTAQDLINLIQIELNKIYHINERAILFYKGIKLHDDELINNLLIKQNEIINLNLTDENNNLENKQNEINEINFEVILIPFEVEENINKEKISNTKKEKIEIKNLNEYNLTKKIVSYLFPKCNRHKEENLIYICLTCSNSFCALDFEEHKSLTQEHNIINKNILVDLNFEVRSVKQNLVNKYDELLVDMNIEKNIENIFPYNNQINYISTNDLFKKIKTEINNLNEKMEILFSSIKEIYQKVNLKFLSIYEEKMPQIIEFSEYMDKVLSSVENLNIFSNENMFIENYDKCLNIKKISDKYYNYIIALKEIIIKYKEFLESFKDKGNNLIDYIRQGIDNIFKIKNTEKIFNSSTTELFHLNTLENNLYKSNNFNNKNNKKNINDISLNTTRDLNQSINLKFLFSDKKPKKYDLFKRENTLNKFNKGISTSFRQKNITINDKNKNIFIEKEKLINESKNNKQIDDITEEIIPNKKYNFGSSNISLNTETNNQNKCSSNISSLREAKINVYSLIYGTSKMIRYSSKSKKLEMISPDLTDLKISKFETYISKLNFKNKFYISGGYSASKSFFEYDSNKNKFIKLKEMISNHYYHNMIGYKNFIYSISGFKSKKVEKYSLIENKWVSLPDLEYERTFPNSLIYNDNLFIFGKINNLKEDSGSNINIIEYINIRDYIPDENKNWTKITIKSNFPFNSGIIKLENTNILVGGKLDINENCINSSYSMNIENINNKYEVNIKLNDSKLEKPDEFGGNNFYALDEVGENFGNFSVINPYLFYIFDKNLNKFSYLEYTEPINDK